MVIFFCTALRRLYITSFAMSNFVEMQWISINVTHFCLGKLLSEGIFTTHYFNSLLNSCIDEMNGLGFDFTYRETYFKRDNTFLFLTEMLFT